MREVELKREKEEVVRELESLRRVNEEKKEEERKMNGVVEKLERRISEVGRGVDG